MHQKHSRSKRRSYNGNFQTTTLTRVRLSHTIDFPEPDAFYEFESDIAFCLVVVFFDFKRIPKPVPLLDFDPSVHALKTLRLQWSCIEVSSFV